MVKSLWFPQESHRVLAAGGLIVGVFFNLVSWRGLAAHLTAPMRRSYDFFELSYKAWKRNLCKSGFSIVQEKGFCWFPFRRMSNSGLIPTSIWMERHFGLQSLPELSPWVVFIAQKRGT